MDKNSTSWTARASKFSVLYSASLSGFSRTWRIPLLIGTSILFCAGALWSFHKLNITVQDLHFNSVAILILLVIPSLFYGGIGLLLLGRSAHVTIPLGRATVISAYAYLAEMLPLPGGAIIRAKALIDGGGTLSHSSALVIFTAILWISLAMIGAGITLLATSSYLAWPLLLLGSGFTVAIAAWLGSTAGITIAAQTLLHRVSGIILAALRIQFAFMALGTPIRFSETMPFVLALLMGSASSVAPAGLGVSESLAALAATTSAYHPSVAFLAVGLDRLVCLAGCCIFALLAQFLIPLRSAPPREGLHSSKDSDP